MMKVRSTSIYPKPDHDADDDESEYGGETKRVAGASKEPGY